MNNTFTVAHRDEFKNLDKTFTFLHEAAAHLILARAERPFTLPVIMDEDGFIIQRDEIMNAITHALRSTPNI